MNLKYLIIGLVCVMVLVAGGFWYLSMGEDEIGEDIPSNGLEVSSQGFERGGDIPQRHTSDGSDLSPPLTINGAEGESMAIIMDDPDSPGGIFTHWVIWGIPTDINEIPEGVIQMGTVDDLGGANQGTNDFGGIGYRGPKPPEGEEHEYRIFVYTLDRELNLSPGATKTELREAMEGHILQQTEINGFYER